MGLHEWLRRFRRGTPEAEARAAEALREGNACAERGDEVAALRAYGEAVRHSPGLGAAWNNLGSIHMRRGELEQAHQAIREAVRVDPTNPNALYNLGVLSVHRGDLKRAVKVYEQLRRVDGAYAAEFFTEHLGF